MTTASATETAEGIRELPEGEQHALLFAGSLFRDGLIAVSRGEVSTHDFFRGMIVALMFAHDTVEESRGGNTLGGGILSV